MTHYFGLIVISILLNVEALEVFNDAIPVVEAVEGGHAAIPCNVPTPLADEEATLILWYSVDKPNPIYTLDVRNVSIKKARKFPSTEMEGRADFDVTVHPPVLILKDITLDDEADYRCRVDLRRSRTLILHSRLVVIVPPNEPIIMDEHGQRLHNIVGPYDEGSTIKFVCEVDGGDPSPNVTWWRGQELIDEDFSIIRQRFVRNELILKNIQRSDFLKEYSCQASNTHVAKPIVSSIQLDINLLPLRTRILGSNSILLAGEEQEFVCETRGSRPKALTSWWLESHKIGIGTSEVAREKGNVTLSTLNFTPSPADNGKRLICKSANPVLPKSTIEDEKLLRVQFVPIVNLTFGSNTGQSGVKENNMVSFECNIWANPWVFEIVWKFQDKPLFSNRNSVIITNQTLMLPKVRKEHRGRYQCLASNSVGQGSSNYLHLIVQFSPTCKSQEPKTYGVTMSETANVTCDIEANPYDVFYKWSFNNSYEVRLIQNWTRGESNRYLTYSIENANGYGTLLCWGRNSIGSQRDPCVIKIIPAGAPEPPHNCTVSNQSSHFLFVECEPSYDGGLTQTFHLEVYNSVVEHMDGNITRQDKPRFKVENLTPGTSYVLLIYSSNIKGKSNSVALVSSTLNIKDPKTDETDELTLVPVLWILIGIVTVFVTSVLVIVIFVRLHFLKGAVRKDSTTILSSTECEATKKEIEDSQESTSEKGPDIIPLTIESDVFYTGRLQEESIYCSKTESSSTKYVHEKYTDTVL